MSDMTLIQAADEVRKLLRGLKAVDVVVDALEQAGRIEATVTSAQKQLIDLRNTIDVETSAHASDKAKYAKELALSKAKAEQVIIDAEEKASGIVTKAEQAAAAVLQEADATVAKAKAAADEIAASVLVAREELKTREAQLAEVEAKLAEARAQIAKLLGQ